MPVDSTCEGASRDSRGGVVPREPHCKEQDLTPKALATWNPSTHFVDCSPPRVGVVEEIARIEREHLVHVWIAACRSGDLQHADDDMPNVAAVNIGVTAVQVAEGTREAVRDTLEEDVAVAIAVQLGERAGQTKLERGVSRP